MSITTRDLIPLFDYHNNSTCLRDKYLHPYDVSMSYFSEGNAKVMPVAWKAGADFRAIVELFSQLFSYPAQANARGRSMNGFYQRAKINYSLFRENNLRFGITQHN